MEFEYSVGGVLNEFSELFSMYILGPIASHFEAASLATIVWTGAFWVRVFVALGASMPVSVSVVRPLLCRLRSQPVAVFAV